MRSSNPNEPALVDPRLSLVDGQWLPHGQIGIHVEDVGFRQGVVAVERLRTYHGSLFALDQHLDRWQSTTHALAIDGLPSRLDISAWMSELLQRNGDWVQSNGDVGVTMVATPGIPGAGATFLMHLNPLNHEQIERRRQSGQTIVVTDVTQPDDSSWPRGIKTRARIHYYLADRQARRTDADAIGVLLDQDGSITETSIANVAVVRAGTIISPPSDRVLCGVTQSIIETLASEASMTWQRKPISPDELRSADEILLMGTDGGIWFANAVDGSPLRGSQPGPTYQNLRRRFDSLALAS